MTDRELLELAREAGFKERNGIVRTMHSSGAWVGINDELKEYARLVRAASLEEAAAELRRLHAENEALKAAQYECGFGAGCCYQAAKSEADEALLRQAVDRLETARFNEADPVVRQHYEETIAAIKEHLK